MTELLLNKGNDHKHIIDEVVQGKVHGDPADEGGCADQAPPDNRGDAQHGDSGDAAYNSNF